MRVDSAIGFQQNYGYKKTKAKLIMMPGSDMTSMLTTDMSTSMHMNSSVTNHHGVQTQKSVTFPMQPEIMGGPSPRALIDKKKSPFIIIKSDK